MMKKLQQRRQFISWQQRVSQLALFTFVCHAVRVMGKVRQKSRRLQSSTATATQPLTLDAGAAASTVLKPKKKDKRRDKHDSLLHKMMTVCTPTTLKSLPPAHALTTASRRPCHRCRPITKTKKKRLRQRAANKALQLITRKPIDSVANMRTLLDALPTLDQPPSSSKSTREPNCQSPSSATTAKKKPLRNFKTAKHKMMKDIAVFRQVLKHPAYLADPAGAIATHLRNTIEMSEAMEN